MDSLHDKLNIARSKQGYYKSQMQHYKCLALSYDLDLARLSAELTNLRAENERLREALLDVMIQDEYRCIRDGVVVKDLGCCGYIAMDALK